MKTFPIYCAGAFVKEGRMLEVREKYTGKVFAQTWQAGDQTLHAAIRAANAVRKELSQISSHERYEQLMYISNQVLAKKEELAAILCAESAKPMYLATAEIGRAAQTFLVAAEESKRLPREYIGLDWTAAGKGREGMVRYFPTGVVAGISPFNFPMNLAVHKIAPAIAAGCPIILKPASATPLSTLALASIIHDSGVPAGSVSILPMDRETGNRLATEENIHLLSFTGSPEAGWELKKQSGKKKVVLELGGNAGVIIDQNTDIESYAEKFIAGAFAYSGQICIHAQRFIVHESLFRNFCDLLVRGAEGLKRGDPMAADTRISVMINEDHAKRVESWVQEAVDQGAEILAGGYREGSFYAPTVLTRTKSSMKVISEEVFGPVVCVESFTKTEEAVDSLNTGRFGLQCGIFTDSVTMLDYVFMHAETGGVIHNDVPTLRFDHMPYGGVKDSGLGREGVRYAIQDMLEARILVK